MIKKLKNPKTDNYFNLKQIALSDEFHWYWQTTGNGIMYYCHTLITRPEQSYSKSVSPYSDLFAMVMGEILHANDLAKNGYHILRGAVNCVHPSEGTQVCDKHVDHYFPHINLITYLTDVGGKTFCGKKEHDPKEDDAILMKGEHCHERPKRDRRVVLVSTIQCH